jgi:hypothetical protein
MMAYLTRPGFKDGTPLKKDFPDMSNTEIIETTETSDVLVPPQKPGSQLTLNDEVEALKKILPAFEPKSQVYRVQKFLEKALEKEDTFLPPENESFKRVSRTIEVLYDPGS